MSLKLMYITRDVAVAKIAEKAGVDRLWVDLEYIGKADRQGGLDTVQNRHTPTDVGRLRAALTQSEVMVRVNPIHDALPDYFSTEDEVNAVIDNGAQLIMLPFFQEAKQVERFVKAVRGRAKTMLLVETPEAVEKLDEILSVGGIDEVHIGLNDLHLGYHKKFMFELLADGTTERLMERIRAYKLPCGFGGVGRPGSGTLPADYILGEHVRLKSDMVILSRSFCNTDKITDLAEIENIFINGVADVRRVEEEAHGWTAEQFEANRLKVCECVRQIIQ